MNRSLLLMLSLLGCQGPVLPDRESPVWADVAGDPIEGLTDEQLVLYEQGREVMSRAFSETCLLYTSDAADE